MSMTLQEMVSKATKLAVNEVQWAAALWRLDKENKIKYTSEDIPMIVQEVLDDVSIRHKDKIVEKIYNIIKSDIAKEAVKGLGDWYKKQLIRFQNDKIDDDIDIGTPAVA